MPRPVVPIMRLPRKRSVTLSRVVWYEVIRCALALTFSFETSTPRADSASSSWKSTSRSTTTPFPMTGVTPGVRMPEGSRCSAYFSSPTTTVWPALLPPLNLTTQSVRSPSRSVALPLPSSPHWTPTITIPGMGVPPGTARCSPGLHRQMSWPERASPSYRRGLDRQSACMTTWWPWALTVGTSSPAVVHLFGPAEDPHELDDLAARGAEAAGPVPEALVGGGGQDTEIHARRLVVDRREDGIEAPAADAPRMPPVGDV